MTLMLVVGAGSAVGQGAAPADAFPDALDRYIRAVRDAWEIPGLAIAVVRGDAVLAARGYGVRRLGAPEPVDAHTVFDIASLSKAFTATAAAMLVDRGRLRWDQPVRELLPDLMLPTPELTDRVTVRDLLAHRTGLDPANMMWVLTGIDRAEVVRRMRYLRAVDPFRARMTYSNVGYTLAGEALAAAAGSTFEALLRDAVIRPLGLRETTWSYDQAAGASNAAAPHATIGGRQEPIRRETQRGTTAPAGAVQSSAHDMAQWMRFHLAHGVLDGVRHVSDSAMAEMHRVQAPIPTTPAMRAARMVQDTLTGYGLGWQVMDYRGHHLLWHSGNGDGQIAYIALLPDEGLGVAVLVNTWSAPMVHGALVSRIMDTYLGYPERDWAGEALERVRLQARAADSARAAMVAMRSSSPLPLPLATYVGRYEHPLFGPVLVRERRDSLTLAMGGGQEADLEHHGGGVLYARWRDPLYRELFGAHVVFTVRGDSVLLSTQVNRDAFTAGRRVSSVVLDSLTLVDPGRPADPAPMSVFVRDGRIAAIYPAGSRPVPAGATVENLAGRFAIPGLIDGHVHLTAPFTRPGQQDSLSRFFLEGGVTAIRDMAGIGPVLAARARSADEGSVVAPRIYYSTIVAGPGFFATDPRARALETEGVAGRLPWARTIAADSDAVRAAEDAVALGASGIKIYAELPAPLVAAVVREAHARSLKVWSHATIFPARPSDAVTAGVDELSHAFMLVLEPREGLAATYSEGLEQTDFARYPADGPQFEALLAAMRARGTALEPTLNSAQGLASHARVVSGEWGFLVGIDRWTAAMVRRVHRAGISIVAGTDASGYPGRDALPRLHEELAQYVDLAGMTPIEALATATVNAARALGAERDIGAIAEGRYADLVILDADPRVDIRHTRHIQAVVKGGVVHRRQGALVWRPSWPGTSMAVVRGDPLAGGPFTFRFRMPDGYWICPHTHPVTAHIRTISGTFLVGVGEALGLAAARALVAGQAIELAPGMVHYEGTRGATEVEVSGVGPWGIRFLDPAADPGQGGVCAPRP